MNQEFVGDWELDPTHSRIGFSARHAMVTKIRGAFNEVAGEVHIDQDGWEKCLAKIEVAVASIDTRQPARDEHLKGEEFFDAASYPTITFISTDFQEDEEDPSRFTVTGELTMRGITRSIEIPLELLGISQDPAGFSRAGFEGSRRINRKDWDVSWNANLDAGGVMISDKISLEFELSLIRH
ncbi:MAG: YceI family protein [Rothia sp. (in: high G+C Gram-positive bacteria)]|nr:YceI family protein [Rothia sp. (in: high G+C Gram-positive bacteria)]